MGLGTVQKVKRDSTVGLALRGLVSTKVRVAVIVATVLVGVAAASGSLLVQPLESRDFVGVVALPQLVASVLTPFSTALLTHDLGGLAGKAGLPSKSRLRDRWVASGLYGIAMGALVTGVCLVAFAVAAGPVAVANPWAGAGPAVLGGLLVQLIPVGVGCAAGLLIPQAWLACLATIVVPLTFTVLVGAIAPPGTVDWITPLSAAGHLVPGPMNLLTWAQWLLTGTLWVLLPNLIGRRRLAARRIVRG